MITNQRTNRGNPDGWRQVRLGDVADINKTTLGNATPAGYEFRYLDLSGVDLGTVTLSPELMNFGNAPSRARRIVEHGDVLMATVRPNLLGHCIADFDVKDVICSTGFAVLHGKDGVFDNYYLYLYLFSRKLNSDINNLLVGSSYPAVNSSQVANLKLDLPPLPEQRRIVAILGTWDKAIDELKKIIETRRRLNIGLMQKILSGTIRLPGFTGKWKMLPFGEIVGLRKEHLDPRNINGDSFCIELENIDQGTGRLLGGCTADGRLSLKSVFKSGDILFGKLRAYLRKYWLADRAGVCSTEIWVLVPNSSHAISEFIFEIVKTEGFIELAGITRGTHMPRSDWDVVRDFEIRVPEIDEQKAIIGVIRVVNSEMDLLEKKLVYFQSQKTYLLNALMTGAIRTSDAASAITKQVTI